jgi:hypothetical protein
MRLLMTSTRILEQTYRVFPLRCSPKAVSAAQEAPEVPLVQQT